MKRSLIALAALAVTAAQALGIAARPARHIRLSEDDKPVTGLVRFLGQALDLGADPKPGKQTWITLARTGKFYDPRYGDFEITPKMLAEMVSNFERRVTGLDVFIDVAHVPDNGAAATIVKLAVESGRLRALVEWTAHGIEAVLSRKMKYLSAEYHENWEDNEKRARHGCVLLGAGLTLRPVIRGNEAVQLSEDDHAAPVRTAVSPNLLKELTEPSMKYLEQLKAKLLAIGLSEDTVTKLLAQAKTQLDPVAADAAKCEAIVLAWETTGQAVHAEVKKLAGAGGEKNITITLAAPAGATTAPDVAGEVTRQLAQLETQRQTNQTALDGKLKLLSDTIKAGDTTLTEEGVKTLAEEMAPMITAVTTDDQVKHLADVQVKRSQAMSAAVKLASLGYRSPSGSVHISVPSDTGIKALQTEVDKRLGLVDAKDSRRFERTGGELLEANKKFAEKVLAEFDAANGHHLVAEHKLLSGGTGSVSDVAVPKIAERTVIREALYDLVSLNFMDVGTSPFTNVITIPYSYRDTTAAGVNALRRYEGQGIRRGGVIQTEEETRPIPQKLAFRLSSEMQMLVSSSVINFEPVAENMRNMIRIVGEDTEAINLNELAVSADEYGAVAVSNEALTAHCNGTKRIFALANFPVVKPRKVYDLKGVQQGSTVNPITVTLNSVARTEYVLPADGSALAAGWYWIMNYNTGEFQFVDQDGAAQTPTNGWVLTVSYSYSTNVKKFDTDIGSVATDVFWDTLLFAIGGRKAVIEDDRFYAANMILMSGNVNNSLSQAKSFQANSARNATGLASDGSVGTIKDMPVWRPRAPGSMFGDTRILVGQRATSRFRMVKPWSTQPLEQARDSNGLFIDSQEGFGTQWVASHTPTQLKAANTSVILYSTTGRVSR